VKLISMTGTTYDVDLMYLLEVVGNLDAVTFPMQWTVRLSNGKIVSCC